MTLLDTYYYDDSPQRRARQLYTPRFRLKAKAAPQRKVAFVAFESPTDVSSNFLRRLEKSLPSTSSKQFAEYFAKLDALATDNSLLVEGTDAPSPAAVAIARTILRQLETEALEPTRVVASAEGGVGICFVAGDKYADIECFNAGEILGAISNRRDRPTIWKIEPSAAGFAEATARIRDFLGGTAVAHDEKR